MVFDGKKDLGNLGVKKIALCNRIGNSKWFLITKKKRPRDYSG